MTRAGFIIGSNIEYANRLYYEEKLIDLTGYNDKFFEIKPKTVWGKRQQLILLSSIYNN